MLTQPRMLAKSFALNVPAVVAAKTHDAFTCQTGVNHGKLIRQ